MESQAFAWLKGVAVLLALPVSPALAQKAGGASSPEAAVTSFYTFQVARDKGFTVRNVQLRRRFLTPALYGLLLKELNRQAVYSKKHPDEAPELEGDPFTDSQEYPNSFRVGTVVTTGSRARVAVTLNWSTGRGSPDSRNINVELARLGGVWLIDNVINSEGSSLREELKKEH